FDFGRTYFSGSEDQNVSDKAVVASNLSHAQSILKVRMEEMERLWKENASHSELRLHLQETLTLYGQLDALQLEFEEELEAQVESSMSVKQPTDSVGYENRKVSLPHLNLPKFDGDVTRFREFLDQFEVSVYQQVDLSNATKLVYFRGCLITIEYGVALDALRGLSTANQGYELAVQRLKERFDRPLVAVRGHIFRFFHNLNRSSDLSAIYPIFDDSSDEVQVVIGIDYYYRFLGNAIRRGRPSDPVAVETVLEWIICGLVNPRPVPKTEIEGMKVSSKSESDALDPEKRFREELLYDGNRYSTLERRMAREPSRWSVHSSILQSYFENGWAEEVTSEGPKGRTWYLPHHVVSQEGPEAMKHRIVVDGSVKFEGTSLNEQLDPGPKLQADLLGILLRFRRYRVVLQSDIVKMFLQVDLREEDRDVCGFFGGRMNRQVFLRLVNHHLSEKRDCFRTVVDEIKAGIYVDDLVVSCHTIAEAKDFVPRSSELLGSGGFHLAKWASNAPEALWAVPSSHAAILQIAIMLCKPSCLDELYWERLVQSVKTALKATLGQCLASPDELCVVEARMNDRPLTFVGSDVQMSREMYRSAFPDRSDSASRGALSSSLRHLLRRWSYQRKLVDAFWKRWSNLESVTWYWLLTTTLHDAIGPLARSWSCLLASTCLEATTTLSLTIVYKNALSFSSFEFPKIFKLEDDSWRHSLSGLVD
ncbi:hypothetical protein T01_7469, partial [Trichinella spiralis]